MVLPQPTSEWTEDSELNRAQLLKGVRFAFPHLSDDDCAAVADLLIRARAEGFNHGRNRYVVAIH